MMKRMGKNTPTDRHPFASRDHGLTVGGGM